MSLLRSAALALGLMAAPLTPTFAETTPEAVWQALRDEAGPALSGTISRQGDALVVSNGKVRLKDGGQILLPEIQLRQLPGGAVALELPPGFPLMLDGLPGKKMPERLVVQVFADDLRARIDDIAPGALGGAVSADPFEAELNLSRMLGKPGMARLTASGTLVFDAGSKERFRGGPAPLGKVILVLNGAGALIEALVAAGAIPADDVQGVRMGLAAMARPGAAPDQMVSEIEFGEGGSLTVNGIKLR